MNCSECGERLLEGAGFCMGCGRRVGSTVACPECDTALPGGAKFCWKCGTSLEAAAVANDKIEPVLDPDKGRAVELPPAAPRLHTAAPGQPWLTTRPPAASRLTNPPP